MSTSNNKTDCILFLRGTGWDKGLSPEEAQKTMAKLVSWMDGLSQKGIFKGGQPLENLGKTISGKSGKNVADGPFVESKEVVGGYMLIQVDDFDEAVEIARGCPLLDHDAVIEVRPVAEVCPTMQRIERMMAAA